MGVVEHLRAGRRLIVALDTTSRHTAQAWAQAVAPHCGLLKIGLEYYLAQGAAAFAGLPDCPIFLDLKLHDIPNTVAGAVRAILPLRPAMLTLHAAGGAAMLEAATLEVARDAAEAAGSARPLLLAVTVLTSQDAASLAAQGVSGGAKQQVLRLARLALAAGADGLVCSTQEIALLRDAFGAAPVLVVPGIRPPGSAAADQSRIATPQDAMAAGADFLVVGRPITSAADPAAAAGIAADIAAQIA